MPSDIEFADLDAGCRDHIGLASDNVGSGDSSSLPVGLRTVGAAQEVQDKLVKSRVLTGEISGEWIGSMASRYEALVRASRAISSYREPVALFRALAGELQHAMTFDYLGLFLYDEALNKIEMPVLHVVNGPGVAIPADLRAEETITWWVYHNQQPVVISHADNESRFPRG
jgi:hypothetical protein